MKLQFVEDDYHVLESFNFITLLLGLSYQFLIVVFHFLHYGLNILFFVL